jgi:hypothetical protein
MLLIQQDKMINDVWVMKMVCYKQEAEVEVIFMSCYR